MKGSINEVSEALDHPRGGHSHRLHGRSQDHVEGWLNQMAESDGVSGIAVAAAAAGGVLVYAGLQGINPLEALREITSGNTKALSTSQASFLHDASSRTVGESSSNGGIVAAGTISGTSSAIGKAIANAALTHRDELYSQARRWQEGYSDCSSFVGKTLKDVGIKPPGGSVTGSYLVWTKLKTVSKSDIQAGDLLCSGGHIAIALSPTTAIGQQNSRRNVQVGSITSIMTGGGTWNPRRYRGTGSVST